MYQLHISKLHDAQLYRHAQAQAYALRAHESILLLAACWAEAMLWQTLLMRAWLWLHSVRHSTQPPLMQTGALQHAYKTRKTNQVWVLCLRPLFSDPAVAM